MTSKFGHKIDVRSLMLEIFFLVLFFPEGALGEIADTPPVGMNFLDVFKKFDEGQWMKDENLHCAANAQGDVDGPCVSTRERNVEVRHVREATSELQIKMRNDCVVGEQCCYQGQCTPYTVGVVNSKAKYFYGSFRFLMRLAINPCNFLKSKCFGATFEF